jgi:hypothetical protein
MESHHDGARGAIRIRWVALALWRYGELENTVSIVISVIDVEGKWREFS